MSDKEAKRLLKIREGLIELKRIILNDEFHSISMGICGNLTVLIKDDSECYNDINHYMGLWDASKRAILLGKYNYCSRNCLMWKGDYRELRLELIDFIIEKIGEEYAVTDS